MTDFVDDLSQRVDARGWIGAPSFWELVERRAAATPGAVLAHEDTGAELTFAGYRDACRRAAAGLHAEHGVGRDTAVSWELPTWNESLVLVGALARLGARQNPIIPIYRGREVGFITEQSGASLLVVPTSFRGFDFAAMAEEIAAARPGMQVLIADRALPDADPGGLPDPDPLPATSADAPIRWLFYTSGTTADPKGAPHSDLTVMAPALAMSECLDIRADDVSALVFPFTHIGGIGWLLAALMTGCRLLTTETFDPVATPSFLAESGVTLAGSGTPFHRAYLEAQRAAGDEPIFPEVHSFPGGGAPKPPQLHYDLKREVGGLGIVSGYGLTEAPIVVMASTTDPDEKLADTEGRPTPGVDLLVVRLDGSRAEPGEEGEIRVKGPQVIRGYLDPALDADAFDDDGYFRTGDLGIVDEAGYVTITGRLKDVIIRHGENISAKEVEDLLYTHPAIADVAVIGLPDPKTGERACAVVAVKDGEEFDFDAMVAFLRQKELRTQAIPEQLELVDTVPRNPAGKILKTALRERFATAATLGGTLVSPIRRVTLGKGSAEAEEADAAIRSFTGRRFTGKTAVVTGAGSGIGRAVADRLVAEGGVVAALDVSHDAVSTSVAAINTTEGEGRGRAAAFECDVTSESSVGAAFAALIEELGAPTVVCNVAGVGGFYHTAEMTLEQWHRILSVNLTGPFLVCRAALPQLLEHGGSIVNVASNTALMGQSYSAAYCASKAGLLGFSKALAAEYLTRGIRVNVVAPGGVDTPLIGAFALPEGADVKELEKMMTPLGFSTPAEIAASIAFVASDESSYTTGAVLSVDGGLTI